MSTREMSARGRAAGAPVGMDPNEPRRGSTSIARHAAPAARASATAGWRRRSRSGAEKVGMYAPSRDKTGMHGKP